MCRIALNIKKSPVVSYTKCSNLITFNYTIGFDSIERKGKLRDLRVLIDWTLTFSEHISSACRSALVLRRSKTRHHSKNLLENRRIPWQTQLTFVCFRLWENFVNIIGPCSYLVVSALFRPNTCLWRADVREEPRREHDFLRGLWFNCIQKFTKD